ncbi:putative glutathione peroxidase [Mudlarkpox virus]|nr:putative glutathione peroxidase [Mudlarkpox virus]
MAFPCNQFGNQEPGDRKSIMNTLKKYSVLFDVSEKILVNTIYAHPLWKWLQTRAVLGDIAGPIRWNFCKFLISPMGYVIKRFDPEINPMCIEKDIIKVIEQRANEEMVLNRWVVPDTPCSVDNNNVIFSSYFYLYLYLTIVYRLLFYSK